MKIKLKDIKKNPFRDLEIDPINEESVASLKRSIDDHEFWNGLLVRKVGRSFQLVFGHHRLEAAKQAGIEEIDVPVIDWSDDEMVRAMAAENATQRATNFSACANDVAAAMRVLGYAMLTNDKCPDTFSKFFEMVPPHGDGYATAKGKFLGGSGLGEGLLFKYFEQRLTKGVIREVIAELKSADKIAEITDEVIKAATDDGAVFEEPKVEHKEPEFDMAVGQILTNVNHLQSFRKAVSSDTAKQVLPVEKQVMLAKQIVKEIKEDINEDTGRAIALTSENIRERTVRAVLNAQGVKKAVKKAAMKKNDRDKAKHEWSFLRNKFSHAHSHSLKLEELLKIGVIPEDFDSEIARHFFDNEFKQCLATFERVKNLLPITI